MDNGTDNVMDNVTDNVTDDVMNHVMDVIQHVIKMQYQVTHHVLHEITAYYMSITLHASDSQDTQANAGRAAGAACRGRGAPAVSVLRSPLQLEGVSL